MLLVCRFDVDPDDPPALEAWRARARRAAELLAAQRGCERVEVGRATEEPGTWVLVAVFASAADYRRALSPFEVRTEVVPLLSEARTDAVGTFERHLGAGPDGVAEHAPVLDRGPGGPRPRGYAG